MTEECYPYAATDQECLDDDDTCPNVKSSTAKFVLYVSPPYRVRTHVSMVQTASEVHIDLSRSYNSIIIAWLIKK